MIVKFISPWQFILFTYVHVMFRYIEFKHVLFSFLQLLHMGRAKFG